MDSAADVSFSLTNSVNHGKQFSFGLEHQQFGIPSLVRPTILNWFKEQLGSLHLVRMSANLTPVDIHLDCRSLVLLSRTYCPWIRWQHTVRSSSSCRDHSLGAIDRYLASSSNCFGATPPWLHYRQSTISSPASCPGNQFLAQQTRTSWSSEFLQILTPVGLPFKASSNGLYPTTVNGFFSQQITSNTSCYLTWTCWTTWQQFVGFKSIWPDEIATLLTLNIHNTLPVLDCLISISITQWTPWTLEQIWTPWLTPDTSRDDGLCTSSSA